MKGARHWVGNAGDFHPLRIHLSPHGRAFDVNDGITAESLFDDEHAFVLVDLECSAHLGDFDSPCERFPSCRRGTGAEVGTAQWSPQLFHAGDELQAMTVALAPAGCSRRPAQSLGPSGSEAVKAASPGRFELVVDSDAPLSTALVYGNGRISKRVDVLGNRHIDTSRTEALENTASIFVKALRADGEAAWSSPHRPGPAARMG